ncbi:MAG: von Willebrand factor type A domain-containing protein [Oscillospiraceae bacterium]|jgi:Ca-activated chloride channel family protein|nr:von Willebrand factor type A domain-containing protein [Oscillospiraceae bacterium]
MARVFSTLLALLLLFVFGFSSFQGPPSAMTDEATSLAKIPTPQQAEGVPAPGSYYDAGVMTGAGAYMAEADVYMSPLNSFDALADPGFVAARTRPLSTFAADVDTAAYAEVRRMILNQWGVPQDAVRLEELINAFHYNDPAPTGDEPIALASQVAPCPWNAAHLLLRLNLKTQALNTGKLPPSNLVFLIDTSGSMDYYDKLPLVRRAFALLAEQLTEKDKVSIVTYAGSAGVALEGARGNETGKILAAIADLEAGGSTHGAEGIVMAYELAAKYAAPGVNSRVILATDGDFNVGLQSQADLLRLIEGERQRGVFLTVLGFGYGNLKDDTLQTLADHGNGNAAYIDTIHEARRALVDEMGATLVTVAKDVKLQVEFNPVAVEGYRLLGYENRRLQDEDFADDTKDGGEMGAGHSVTAFYELIPAGAGEIPQTQLTYQQDAGDTGSTDYATLHVRYKAPDGDASTELVHPVPRQALTDKPSADFTLGAAVASFGQLLMRSEFAGDANKDAVLAMLQPLLAEDTNGRIAELVTLVRMWDDSATAAPNGGD